MLHEAEVRRQFEAYFLVRQTAFSERCHFPAKVLFVPLAGEAMGVIRDVTHEIDATALNGEYLVITFYVECPFVVQIVVDKHQMPGERRFVRRQQPDLERPFFGHIFSEEDKKNLRESGNMGRVVNLRVRNEDVPSFLSIDRLTNEIVAMKAENAYIPEKISGVTLTDQEKAELRDGKAIYVEGMTSKAGNPFDAYLQFNADRKGLEYIFPNDRIFNRQELGGVALSPKQIEALNAGKAIFVEDMKRKDGEVFSAFVKLDEASGRPTYTRYNPDSPEGAREIYIPKELNGVKLTPEDKKELSEGKAIFIKDMISRRGEVFSSFVRLNMETGNPQYSKTPDGFDQREEFKIPAEVWGVVLTAKQRGQLQDGKAVLVEGMTGYDGKKFSQYVKADFNSGKLNYYNGNPDRDRSATQRNVVAEANNNKQAENQGNKRSSRRSVSQ